MSNTELPLPDIVDRLLAPGHGALAEEAAREIERLREECAEAYQVVGALADQAGVFDNQAVVKALGNLRSAAAGEPRPHADLLPFMTALPVPADPQMDVTAATLGQLQQRDGGPRLERVRQAIHAARHVRVGLPVEPMTSDDWDYCSVLAWAAVAALETSSVEFITEKSAVRGVRLRNSDP
jgi:hypothetical protein